MRHPILLPLLGVATLASAILLPADKVAFKPSDGKQLARSYEIDVDLEIGDVSMMVDGQDMSESMGDAPALNLKVLMQVTDHFVKSSENRQLELIRKYEGLEVEATADDDSKSAEGLDKLEGKSVRFVWNEEEKAYDVAFHESSGEDDVLKMLGADMDLISLLPTREVAPGDKWTVDPKLIFPVLVYGAMADKMDPGGDEIGQVITEALAGQIEELSKSFTLSCEYKGRRDAEGVEVGAIAVKISGQGTLMLADLIEELVTQQVPPEIELELNLDKAEMGMKIEGEGELLWNVAGNHLQAYDMTSKLGMQLELKANIGAQGQSQDIAASIEVDGNGTWKVRPR